MVGTGALRGILRYLTVGIAAVAISVAPWLSHVSYAASGGSAATSAALEYLALGDSIAYGYDPTIAYASESGYIGYPTDVGALRSNNVVNASCPGDSSAGFISAEGASVGCPDVRKAHALHVNYNGTELEFATEFLRSHPATNLVTVGIGVNDVYACMVRTSDHCDSELTSTLDAYRTNLGTILGRLRAIYHGPLVLVNYYSQNYQDPTGTSRISRLNAVMAQVAPNYGAIVADEFTAFAAHTAHRGGDGCRAGLLIKGPAGCNGHLTPAGRNLMATTILQALK
jgi:lysophospholipase L1-like esterase